MGSMGKVACAYDKQPDGVVLRLDAIKLLDRRT